MKRSVVLLVLLLFITANAHARMKAYADYPKNGYVFWLTKNVTYHNIICKGHFKDYPDASGNSIVYDRDLKSIRNEISCKSSTQKFFSHPELRFDCPRKYLHQWYGAMWKSGGGVSFDFDINYFRFRQYCPNPPCYFALCGPLEYINVSEDDYNKNFESYETFDPISNLGEFKEIYIENTINKYFESLNEAIPRESVNSSSLRAYIDTLDLGKLNSFM